MPNLNQDEFQLHVVSALAELKTQMTSLVGNGQPGRITKMEDKIESLLRARWTMGGAITAVSIVASAVFHYFFK